jgi:hypothetical protein
MFLRFVSRVTCYKISCWFEKLLTKLKIKQWHCECIFPYASQAHGLGESPSWPSDPAHHSTCWASCASNQHPLLLLHLLFFFILSPHMWEVWEVLLFPAPCLHFIKFLWWRCLKKMIHGIKNSERKLWRWSGFLIKILLNHVRVESLYTWPNYKACHSHLP